MSSKLEHHWARWPAASGYDQHGVGIIDDSTCRVLLQQGSVGRLGLTSAALPAIFPVNYVVRDDGIVFDSAVGTKVRAAARGDVACFQLDDVDVLEHRGWSVLATGRLELVAPEEVAAMGDLRLVPWAVGGDVRTVRLRIELLSGRVIGHS
jgi:hypothetical protein